MALSRPLIALLLGGSMSYASTLSVYQNNTFYTYIPTNNFIGFTQNISAKCDGGTLALSQMISCPEAERLCKDFTSLERTSQELASIQANSAVLEKLITLPKPTTYDVVALIGDAKLIGKEEARLSKSKKELSKKLRRETSAFRKQAPSTKAIQTTHSCVKALELRIPYGYVSFKTTYEADILDDKNITVTQSLELTNRSGIDIEADTAMFYYRSSNQHVNAIHFSPWVVRKMFPQPKHIAKKLKRNRAMQMDSMPVMAMSENYNIATPAPIATYEDAREYKIKNLTLPSTGVPIDVKVLTWNESLKCEIKAYPYVDTQAFNVCSFKPKYQIEYNSWKVKTNNVMLNENAVGEYRDGEYQIYTAIDEDIKIVRNKIVQKERSTGIFGGVVRKKDGFTLTLTNKSDKPKTLTLIERIPTSTTTEITSKLLSISSKKKVDYKMLKEGEIEMHITLKPNSKKVIEVLFEISYDKDVKVNY